MERFFQISETKLQHRGKKVFSHPAEQASISCLLAFVNAERTAATIKVNERTTPMELAFVAIFPATDIL